MATQADHPASVEALARREATLATAHEPAPVDVEDAACVLCGGTAAAPIASGKDYEYRTSPRTFTFVRCDRCGHIFLNPRPTSASATAIYPTTYYTLRALARAAG